MRTPILPVDVDNRYAEVAHLAGPGNVFELSEERADNADVQAIDRLLKKNMPGSGVSTIVVDSVTPIFARITRRNQMEVRGGQVEGNKSAIHAEKADAMALLSAAVTAYGTDTLWVWHVNAGKFNGADRITQTISNTEVERLWKHLNAILEVVIDEKKNGLRGIRILRARAEHAIDKIIWDTPENAAAGTFWKGMPERIEDLLYPKNPQGARATAIPAARATASSTPAPAAPAAPAATATPAAAEAPAARTFASPAEAIAWGAAELCINPDEAAAVYESVKTATKPKKSSEMWAAWMTEVQNRQANLAAAAVGENY
jgi:hypothetical protein